MGSIMNRFVVVGSVNEGTGEVTKYDASESRLATAIYRADLEDAEKGKAKIVFDDHAIAKIKSENEETIKMLFGNVE